MNYYYLDSKRNICGPYSREQMCAYLLNGTITPESLCAAAGEQNWRPLSEQEWMRGSEAAETPKSVNMGNCPCCGAEQVGFQLPSACSSCGAPQAPKDSSMWSFFCLALRRLFCFKGRSQRKEYWAYVLFSCLFILLSDVLIIVGMFGHWIQMGTLLIVYNSLVGLLIYPLLVRRLHDIGLSGRWIIIPFVLSLISCITTVNAIIHNTAPPTVTALVEEESGTMSKEDFSRKYPGVFLSEGQGEIQYRVSKERYSTFAGFKQIEEITDRINYPFGTSPAMKTVAQLFSILNQLVGILIFVAACIDSRRGANKYGPSSKYTC